MKNPLTILKERVLEKKIVNNQELLHYKFYNKNEGNNYLENFFTLFNSQEITQQDYSKNNLKLTNRLEYKKQVIATNDKDIQLLENKNQGVTISGDIKFICKAIDRINSLDKKINYYTVFFNDELRIVFAGDDNFFEYYNNKLSFRTLNHIINYHDKESLTGFSNANLKGSFVKQLGDLIEVDGKEYYSLKVKSSSSVKDELELFYEPDEELNVIISTMNYRIECNYTLLVSTDELKIEQLFNENFATYDPAIKKIIQYPLNKAIANLIPSDNKDMMCQKRGIFQMDTGLKSVHEEMQAELERLKNIMRNS